MKWITLLFLVWICCPDYLQAQPNRFISFSATDGLSQNSVTCIFQDRDGLLWLGTQDGLNSFDGKNFKQYRYNPADTNTLSDYYVLSIAEDALGSLWIGTGSGLNKLNKRTGKIIRYYLDKGEKRNPSALYTQLFTTPDGSILVAHSNPSVINNQGKLKPLPKAFIRHQFVGYDKEKNLWGIYQRKKLVCFGKSLQANTIDSFAAAANNIYHPKSVQATMDTNGILWVYTDELNSRLFFFDTKTKKWLADSIRLPTVINHISIMGNGSGWVSTLNGVYIIKNYTIDQHLTYSSLAVSGMLPGNILYAYEDRQYNKWIGSAGAGFAYYNPVFKNYQITTTGIDNNTVTSFAAINDDKWLGTVEGLFNIKNGVKQHFFKGKRIAALSKDKQNNLWVAVRNEGLYIVNSYGKLLKSYLRHDTLLSTTNILYLFTDSRGRVFVCTEVGYFVFSDKDHWKSFYERRKDTKPSATGWYALHAFEDRQQNIWISKHLGIDVLDKNLQLQKRILSNDSHSPISRSIVTGCTEDKNGHIWIATLRSGVYVYDHKKLKQFTTADGLTSNLIYGIVCDNQGKIWATTTSGINVYEPSKKRFFSISTSDGLPATEYMLGALYKNEKGAIVVGSTIGLVSIDADKFLPQTKTLAAQISNIRVNEESVEKIVSPFVLQYGYKTCSFEFSIKEALQPQNIIYQYRLKGLNDKWNTVSDANPKITYSNLPFQEMVMEVRAAYSVLDIASAPVSSIRFSVAPPYWKTLWFSMLMIVAAFGISIVAIWQYNKARYNKKIAALAIQYGLQQERERISRDLHDNIGAYTSALISGINQLKKSADSKPESFDELNDYASNIMGYLRETIWVLNTSRLMFTAFADRYKNYAVRIIRNYPGLSIQFQNQVEQERELTPQQSLNLFRVLQEALQNACNHAGASQVQVGFSSNEKLHVWVNDNGSGINPNDIPGGNGLQNMKERATEIGFTLAIASEKGKGTTVSITEIAHLH